MPNITIDDLKKIKEEHRATEVVREGRARATILVHMGSCGIAAGARTVLKAFLTEVKTRALTDIIVTITDCAGNCSKEPMVTVEMANQPPIVYGTVTEENAREIFSQHIMGGVILEQYRVEERAEQ